MLFSLLRRIRLKTTPSVVNKLFGKMFAGQSETCARRANMPRCCSQKPTLEQMTHLVSPRPQTSSVRSSPRHDKSNVHHFLPEMHGQQVKAVAEAEHEDASRTQEPNEACSAPPC